MTQTYNPIQGPFDRLPKKTPGTVIVVLDSRGASLHAPDQPQPLKRLPPPDPGRSAPSLLSASTTPSLPPPVASPAAGAPTTGAFNPEVSEKLSRFGKIAIKEGSKFAVWGSKKLLEGAQKTEWGAKLLGGDRTFCLVDVSPRSFEDEIQISSKDSTLYFIVTVSCDVHVSDPCGVVRSGITDVRSHFSTRLKRLLSEIGGQYPVHDLPASRKAMQARLDTLVGDAGTFDSLIAVSAVTVDVRLDEKAAALVRTASEVDLKLNALGARGQVDAKAREVERQALESVETMLAQWLQTGRPEYREVLEHKLQGARTQREQDILRLEFMLQHGIIEAQDIHKRYPDLVGDLLSLPSKPIESLPAPKVELPSTPTTADNA